jgi:hypothetical protein
VHNTSICNHRPFQGWYSSQLFFLSFFTSCDVKLQVATIAYSTSHIIQILLLQGQHGLQGERGCSCKQDYC